MAGATEETVNELIVAAGVDRGGAAKEFCERAEVTAPGYSFPLANLSR
jgi:hypothetical protein